MYKPLCKTDCASHTYTAADNDACKCNNIKKNVVFIDDIQAAYVPNPQMSNCYDFIQSIRSNIERGTCVHLIGSMMTEALLKARITQYIKQINILFSWHFLHWHVNTSYIGKVLW